jgi:N6-adenosine-specific RNA methylase IME4
MNFPEGKFKVIYADPPWLFRTWSQKGEVKSPSQHYSCMNLEDICKLPVSDIAMDDSVLFLWVIQSMLPEALKLMAAWGFGFKTVAYCWIKMPKKWQPLDERIEPRMGLGYHTRCGMEQCWLGTRGKGYPRQSAGVAQVHHSFEDTEVLHSPLRQHSRKPDEFALRTEQLCGDVPRIELFGRVQRPGWTVWGNEVKKFTPEERLF